jgi:hypothetical protein
MNTKTVINISFFFCLFNLSYFIIYFIKFGFLPTPFLYDKNDTFMDFFNPIYWVLLDSFYNTFNSVYPPLNHIILKIFSLFLNTNNVQDSFELRTKNTFLIVVVTTIYLSIILFVSTAKKITNLNVEQVFISIICIFSIPTLFGIERGNLIFFGVLFLFLYLNTSNNFLKFVYIALAINIKPYFCIFLIQYINFHNFNLIQIIKILLITFFVFISLGLFTDIDYMNYIKSFFLFGKNTTLSREAIISLPHSLSALSLIKSYMRIEGASSFKFFYSTLKLINYIFIFGLLYLSITKKLTRKEFLISSVILCTNFSISSSGYILILYVLLIPYLRRSFEYKKIFILILLIFTLPLDWLPIIYLENISCNSFLAPIPGIINCDLFISLNTFIRPLLNFYILCLFFLKIFFKYKNGDSNFDPRYLK